MKRTQRIAAASLMALSAHVANASDWVGTTGDWFEPLNWSGGVPTAAASDSNISNGGTATIAGGSAAASNLALGGGNASGTVVQTGGQLAVSGWLNVGSTKAGSYTLSGAASVLSVGGLEDIGWFGPAAFIQSGGTHAVTGYLRMGTAANATYQLDGGTLSVAGNFTVGQTRASTMTQTGGSVSTVGAGSILYVGFLGVGPSAYNLSGGAVNAARQVVGLSVNGTFNQTGGTNTAAESLSIGPSARYNLAAGALAVGSFDNAGTIDFAGGAGTFDYSGIADFSKGTIANHALAKVTGGATSLIMLPAGADPATYFGTFTSVGLTHVAGTTLNIPAGRTVHGAGNINDAVALGGSLSGDIFLRRGLAMTGASSSADVNLLDVIDNVSGMTGGTLVTGSLRLGPSVSTVGTFAQSGGTNASDSLLISPGSRYVFSGGSLQTSYALQNNGTIDFGGGSGGNLGVTGIADLAAGAMIAPSQVDVTLAPSSLLLLPAGFDPTTQFKSFTNSGGIVHVRGTELVIPGGTSIVGGSATIADHLTVNGAINGSGIALTKGVTVGVGAVAAVGSNAGINDVASGVNGGTLSVSNLSVGQTTAGKLEIDGGGTISASGFVTVGEGASGAIVQNSGTLTASSGLRIGLNAGSAGSYTLSGGRLSVSSTGTGSSIGVAGTFFQTGGTHTTSGVTLVPTGTYSMSAGTLTATGSFGGGILDSGAFDQAGGGVTTTTLTVGGTTGTPGTYTMTGGTLGATTTLLTNSGGRFTLGGGAVTAGSLIVKGTFTHNGGTWSATSLEVSSAGRVNLAPGAAVTPRVTALFVADQGKINLGDNAVVITGSTVGTASGGTYNGVSGLVQSGYHGGDWNGTRGILTSMPDAAAGLTSIGVATAGQTGYAGGTFRGVSVTANNVLLMYTYKGDANLDGFISGDDYAAIDFNIAVPNASGWFRGDFNYDGIISGDDYTMIDFNIVAQGTPFPTSGSAGLSGVAAVPEPHSIAPIVAGVVSLLSRRRRRAR